MLQRCGFAAANGLATALFDTASTACVARAAGPAVASSIPQTRQLSNASPSLATEQDRKNYGVLQYLSQRPVDTAFRIGALAGLGVAMRDLSLVLNTIYQKDVRGIDHPEIAAQEVKNTISFIQSLDRSAGLEVKEQLMLHIARIIPELSQLTTAKGHAAARRKVALCSKQDQEVIHRLFPELLSDPPSASTAARGAEKAAAAAGPASVAGEEEGAEGTAIAAAADGAASSTGADAAAEADGLVAAALTPTEPPAASSSGSSSSSAFAEDLSSPAALAREARTLHASGRFSRVRFPVWDVTKLDDAPAAGQTLRPRHMNRLPWMALLPPHLEVSYQTMTAIPLFPMQEASYPEFVDFDYAMYYLSRFTRRYKRSRARVRSPRR